MLNIEGLLSLIFAVWVAATIFMGVTIYLNREDAREEEKYNKTKRSNYVSVNKKNIKHVYLNRVLQRPEVDYTLEKGGILFSIPYLLKHDEVLVDDLFIDIK